jgi:hypothetical protein
MGFGSYDNLHRGFCSLSDVEGSLQSQETSRTFGDWSKLIELWRIERPLIFFKHALQRYAAPLFNELYIFEFDLARASEFESPTKLLLEGVTTRLFHGQSEITVLIEILAQGEVMAASVEQRMARGDMALLAMKGLELAGYSWATFKERWIAEARATIVPHEGEVLMYDKRIMPRWRGKGLQYALSVAMHLALAQLGYMRGLVWVDALNARSLKNQRRLGRRKVAAIISSPILRILRVRNYSASGVSIEKREPH